MPDESTPDCSETPTGYWAAFGYQNHLVPTRDPDREARELVGLCGVKTAPDSLGEPDERPTCSVCAEAVRQGRYRLVDRP